MAESLVAPCPQCGSPVEIKQTDEFGPVTYFTATCANCDFGFSASVERVPDEEEKAQMPETEQQ